MIYLLLALFVYVCFALKNNKIIKTTVGNELIIPSEKNKQKISWLAVVVLILFSGLRAHIIGNDLPHYKIVFGWVGENHDITRAHGHYGFLFNALIWLSSILSVGDIGFTILLTMISVIVVLTVVYVAKTISTDISMAMFAFCVETYIVSFSALRQSLAVGLVMIAFKYIYEKRPLKFVAMVLLATYFHDSAIFVLPLYLLNYVSKSDFENVFYLVGVTLIVFYSVLDEVVLNMICKFLGLHYFYSYGMVGDKLTMMSYLKAFMLIAVFIFFLVYKLYKESKGKSISRKYSLSLLIYFFVMILNVYNIITGAFMIISRMTYYFSWVLILLVPEFLESIESKKWKKIFTVLVLIAGLCYLSTTVVIRDQFSINPYKTIYGI